MNKFSTALLAGLFITVSGCSTTGTEPKAATGGDLDAAIKQAETNIAAVKKVGFEWRLVDKSAGKKSVPISKLLKLAKKSAEKGDSAEAERLLARINFATEMGMKQSNNPGKAYFPPR